MSLVFLILILAAVGVLLTLGRRHLGQYIGAPMLTVITVIVWIVVVLLVLSAFGILDSLNSLRVPQVGG